MIQTFQSTQKFNRKGSSCWPKVTMICFTGQKYLTIPSETCKALILTSVMTWHSTKLCSKSVVRFMDCFAFNAVVTFFDPFLNMTMTESMQIAITTIWIFLDSFCPNKNWTKGKNHCTSQRLRDHSTSLDTAHLTIRSISSSVHLSKSWNASRIAHSLCDQITAEIVTIF